MNSDDILVGRFSARTTQMELRGTAPALRRLANTIRSATRPESICLDRRSDPGPWDGLLTEVRISPADGRVMVTREDTRCIIAGATPFREIMALRIEQQASKSESSGGGKGYHVHFEYFPGEECLAEGSEPLIVGVIG